MERRPIYGQPVLLKILGTVQHITYFMDGADDETDWFEPYFFEHGDEFKIEWDKVDGWYALPD